MRVRYWWALVALGAAVMLTASCGGAGTPAPSTPPLANQVDRSFDVVVVGDPPMLEPVRAEITGWLTRRGYVAAQIRRTPLPSDELGKLTRCLMEELTAEPLAA